MNNDPPLDSSLEELASRLRLELEELGALWNLLSEQQQVVLENRLDQMESTTRKVEEQLVRLHQLREARNRHIQGVLPANLPVVAGESPFRRLLQSISPDQRLMFEALLGEIEKMLERTRQRASQNQTLMTRCLELTGSLLEKISPKSFTRTYSKKGQLSFSAPGARGKLQATV